MTCVSQYLKLEADNPGARKQMEAESTQTLTQTITSREHTQKAPSLSHHKYRPQCAVTSPQESEASIL